MILRNPADSRLYAKKLASRLDIGSVVTLQGPLGVGKTFLVKSLCSQLGVDEEITSPSYVLMNSYMGKVPIFHFDLYRLQEVEEVYELGLYECIEQGVCLIEWPELIAEMLPVDTIRLIMKFKDDNTRQIDEGSNAK